MLSLCKGGYQRATERVSSVQCMLGVNDINLVTQSTVYVTIAY